MHRSLASPHTMLAELNELYQTFGAELLAGVITNPNPKPNPNSDPDPKPLTLTTDPNPNPILTQTPVHKKMRVWCERVKSCKFCDVEAEMLYMLVRKWRPNNVFEMAPNKGYSSHFILSALAANVPKHQLRLEWHHCSCETVDLTPYRHMVRTHDLGVSA